MSLAKIMGKHGEVKPIKRLVEDISKAACKGIENLWSEFLEIGDLGMVRAMDVALRLLTDSGDRVKTMKLLEAIYALTEQEPPREFTACQEYPVLSQMYMEEFLAESGQFIFDVGMDEIGNKNRNYRYTQQILKTSWGDFRSNTNIQLESNLHKDLFGDTTSHQKHEKL